MLTTINSLFKAFSVVVLCAGVTLSLNAQTKSKQYNLASYGIVPNSGKNNTPLISDLLKKIKAETPAQQSVVIKFQKGRYDFYAEGAAIRTYYISNHDQNNPKTVGIALEGFKNLTIEGNGADLMFHGRMLPIALIEGNNVRLKNLSVDFEKPQITQVKIVENDTLNGQIVFETAPWVKYLIKDSVFFNTGEGWQMQPTGGIAFENATKHIIYNSGDIRVGTKGVEELSPGRIKAYRWKNNKLIPGTVIAMRSWSRPAPGIFVHKGKDISLTNVKVHYAEGMGLLAQLTENIYMDGFGVCLRGKNDPRYFTTQADATHFSGCKGTIVSKNGLYEGMMDDAINIHGTYLKLIKKIDNKTVIGKYMHGQSFGFDWGYVKDSVQFIQSKTMELWDAKNTIASITPVLANENDPLKEFRIEFTKELDAEIDPTKQDIGIENLTWTPSVVFTGNTIRNNRARGALFSTPNPTLVANNLFDHTSGSAILLCGDCNGWYETGACRNIEIRDNKFVNALTSMYQFTNAVISIYPEIPDLKNQQKYFHSGIRILNNKFETFDRPILYAKSVDGLIFKDNTITTNKDYPALLPNKKSVVFDRVTGTEIGNNKVDGKTTDLLTN
ncbi:MAG: alpha-1,3-galactosidase B [Bacteroidota bacterium]